MAVQNKIKFEYRITFTYLIVGGLWILFSDKVLNLMVSNVDLQREIQTYKGWFYVIITALFFFLFIRVHLQKLRETKEELKKHQNSLELLINEKTKDLETLNEELRTTNNELCDKNDLINTQNIELKEAFSNLKDAQSKLIQADKMASLGTLTAGVAHEINNPLNYLMGAYNGLDIYFQNHGSKDKKNTDMLLNSMLEGVERTSDIVKGLNQFSRDNSSCNEICDIHPILENCLLILQYQTKSRISIIRKFHDSRLIIKGNVGKLHQVFINLLTNSIQAIKEEGFIIIETNQKDNKIQIEISDNGCGINKEHMSEIMTPFFTTKAPGQGTGLGLSITYSIIQDHHGTLNFESTVDQGTKVQITLPTI